MDYRNEAIYRYKKIISLIEEEDYSISRCMEGEIAEIYRSMLKKEKDNFSEKLFDIRQTVSI